MVALSTFEPSDLGASFCRALAPHAFVLVGAHRRTFTVATDALDLITRLENPHYPNITPPQPHDLLDAFSIKEEEVSEPGIR